MFKCYANSDHEIMVGSYLAQIKNTFLKHADALDQVLRSLSAQWFRTSDHAWCWQSDNYKE